MNSYGVGGYEVWLIKLTQRVINNGVQLLMVQVIISFILSKKPQRGLYVDW